MSNLIRKIFQNHGTRVLALLFASFIVLIAYFLTHSYFVQLNIHKNKILSKLEAVSITAASQIDANQLAYILDHYPKIDQIKSSDQDPIYKILHDELQKIRDLNNLSSALYTLSYDEASESFFFGVSSESNPFYRHKYEHFPKALITHYEEGGRIDVYEDENGHWLSAFAPIKDESGKTVAVVQVDQRFDEFLIGARQEIFTNIFISLAVTLILLFFMLRSMRSILSKEEQLTANLIQSKLELEQKNQETLDSILYAKKIQDAILPFPERIRKYLPKSFVFHLPRDIVSGDFYWFKHTRNKSFIACVDCTGHGVPGAFMSMIGSILLDDIIDKKEIDSPEEILQYLNQGVVHALKQSKKSKASRDGMDIALCVIDKEFKTLEFSGAFRPLIIVRNGELERVKATPTPIGGVREKETPYQKEVIKVQANDTFYIFSDGYPDQFGGENNKKFMTRRFRELLQKLSMHPIDHQAGLLQEELDAWMGANDQVDDILVIGIQA